MGLPIHCNPSNTLNFHFKQKLNCQKTQGSILLSLLFPFPPSSFFFLPASFLSPCLGVLPRVSTTCSPPCVFSEFVKFNIRTINVERKPPIQLNLSAILDVYTCNNLTSQPSISHNLRKEVRYLEVVNVGDQSEWGLVRSMLHILESCSMENMACMPFGFPYLPHTLYLRTNANMILWHLRKGHKVLKT